MIQLHPTSATLLKSNRYINSTSFNYNELPPIALSSSRPSVQLTSPAVTSAIVPNQPFSKLLRKCFRCNSARGDLLLLHLFTGEDLLPFPCSPSHHASQLPPALHSVLIPHMYPQFVDTHQHWHGGLPRTFLPRCSNSNRSAPRVPRRSVSSFAGRNRSHHSFLPHRHNDPAHLHHPTASMYEEFSSCTRNSIRWPFSSHPGPPPFQGIPLNSYQPGST